MPGRGLVIVEIKVDKISDEIKNRLQQYGAGIEEEIQVKADKVAKKGVKMLKSESPIRSGVYAKSWSSKKESGFHLPQRIIHVKKPHYRLTHLLEKGHVGRDGKRVRAIPHIAPVEKKLVKEFEQEIERSIESDT